MCYSISIGDPDEPGVVKLLAASKAYSQSLYPADSIHMLNVSELRKPHVHFFVAKSMQGKVLGCGALVLGHDAHAELKQLFVFPENRGKGFGAAILKRLESEAQAAGVRVIQLETGIYQPEAIALYHQFGYHDREPFGTYRPDPLSVFMEKLLD